MDDLIDEDPPADVIDPPEPPITETPSPPTYAPIPPPNMGNVNRAPSELEMGAIDSKVVFLAPEALPPAGDILRMLEGMRAELVSRVSAIELLIGFVASGDDLAVRVAKLEKFLGMVG